MAVRTIRVFGDPVLRSPADPVIRFDVSLDALITDLLDTVAEPGRAGVAAPQIGVGLRAFSYNIDGDIGYVLNPRLVEVRGDAVPVDEGCLSVPGFGFARRRHPWARVVGVDRDQQPIELSGEGLLAQALQHECDHLDGVLYLEGLDPDVKREAMRAVRQAEWFARP